MKNFTTISITLLMLFITNSKAQLTGTTVAPLQLGNIWVYDVGTALRKITVVDSNIVINNLSYYKLGIGSINEYARVNENGFYAELMDSSYTEPHHELPYYKKDAVIGDTWTVQTYFTYSIEDTFTANVFGEQTIVKYLKMDGGIILRHEYWTEKFGQLSSSDFHGPLRTLIGCVINGVVYGDTITVSVTDDFPGQPKEFFLSQNYPNPFNPITNIHFAVHNRQYVTLKVYDILGNEVKTLINEEKPAGSYEVKFNAAGLPSGNYFYRFTAGNFSETRKMLIIK